ncbi:hypothetical protein Tco_1378909 [Tanacetum coccineum]
MKVNRLSQQELEAITLSLRVNTSGLDGITLVGLEVIHANIGFEYSYPSQFMKVVQYGVEGEGLCMSLELIVEESILKCGPELLCFRAIAVSSSKSLNGFGFVVGHVGSETGAEVVVEVWCRRRTGVSATASAIEIEELLHNINIVRAASIRVQFCLSTTLVLLWRAWGHRCVTHEDANLS